jgi:internalin A
LALEIRGVPLFVTGARGTGDFPLALRSGEAASWHGRLVIRTGDGAIAVERAVLDDGTDAPPLLDAAALADFGTDEKLEAAVRFKLQKPEGDIKVSELSKLRSLNLSQGKTDALDHCLFPHLGNLRELFLGPGKVRDLSLLEGLPKLESLRASLNQVEDIGPLAKLTKMDRLDLGHTKVKDLKPLAEMTSLTELQLDDTPVEDLTPLSGLTKLERLSIQRTRVKDLSPLAKLENLKFLYIAGAPVDNPFQLAPLQRNGLKVIDQ